jgi:hypothetical protein
MRTTPFKFCVFASEVADMVPYSAPTYVYICVCCYFLTLDSVYTEIFLCSRTTVTSKPCSQHLPIELSHSLYSM